MFKASRANLKFHPITGRLVQYKQLLDQMEDAGRDVMKQVDEIVDKLDGGVGIDVLVRKASKKESQLAKRCVSRSYSRMPLSLFIVFVSGNLQRPSSGY